MLNKVTLIGNICGDIEAKRLDNGTDMARLSLATNEKWTDKATGEKKESVEYHRIVFFGAVAGICEKYLTKGSKVYIEGSIHTKKWQDKNGQDRYTTEIKGREMKMLGSPNKGGQAPQQQQPAAQPAGNSGYSADDFDSDIPF